MKSNDLLTRGKFLVLYDGDCALCNYWVNFILKRDKKDSFLFASLQSDFGQRILKLKRLDTYHFNTIYLVQPNGALLSASRAVFAILKILGGWYRLPALLRFLPKGLTDAVYRTVAQNRKRIAVKACPSLSAEQRSKILS